MTPSATCSRRYIFLLVAAVLIWGFALFGFISVVDPYGVSPLKRSWAGFNQYKTKRKEIDRAMKPLEVWRYKPRTLFLGTSRVHEAFNPAILDGTKFAPAYNAAIPANQLSGNAVQVELYARLDHRLKYVFVELFFWDFIYGQAQEPRKTLRDFIGASVGLLFSGSAVWDSLVTVDFNRSGMSQPTHVHTRGYWVYAQGHNPQATFDLFAVSVARIHKALGAIDLQPSAFESVERLLAVCRERNIEVFFLVTPN
jgi:hypothetical protein